MIALMLEIVSYTIIAICVIGTIVLGVVSFLSMYWWLMGDVILHKKNVRKQHNKIR